MLHATKYKTANYKADRDILCLLFLLVKTMRVTHECALHALFLFWSNTAQLSFISFSTIIKQTLKRKEFQIQSQTLKSMYQVSRLSKRLKKPYFIRALIHRATSYHSGRTMYHVSERHLIYLNRLLNKRVFSCIFAL